LPDAGYYKNFKLGLAGGVWNLQQKSTLGYAFPVMFTASNTILSRKETGLHYRAAIGVAYVTKPFDASTNKLNNAYAQAFVASLQVGLVGKIRLAPQILLRVEAGLAHLSAGAFRLPNYGLNMPYLTFGMQQAIGQISQNQIFTKRPSASLPQYSLWAMGALGAKQALNSYDPLSLGATLRIEGWRRFGNRSAWVLGVDAIYGGALAAIRQDMGLGPASPWRFGIATGHDWLFAKAAFSTQVGVYVLNPSPQIHKAVYQRYGVRFWPQNRLVPAVFLRAHGGQADCIEWALTYRLYQK
jgi:hypothetical protein